MVKDIPNWSQTYIDTKGVARVEAAVRAAEMRTSGEIVPVLVRRSTTQGLVPLVLGLLFPLLILAVQDSLRASIDHHQLIYWNIALVVGAVLGFSLGKIARVQRWIIPVSQQKIEAERRAMLEFYWSDLSHTKGGTGIILFVSLLEHQAVVLADQGIAQHCKPEIFDAVVADLIQGAKKRDLASGFEAAIARCTDLLAPHFPRQEQDVNELGDLLIFRDR